MIIIIPSPPQIYPVAYYVMYAPMYTAYLQPMAPIFTQTGFVPGYAQLYTYPYPLELSKSKEGIVHVVSKSVSRKKRRV